MADIEEESPDLINMEIDFGDITREDKMKNNAADQGQEIVSDILTSDIPPEEWQREIEKVSSKIKIDYNASNYSTGEWRAHIDQIKLNETVRFICDF